MASQCMGITVQGTTDPDRIVGKKCRVSFFELDYTKGRVDPKRSDLLAAFDTCIIKGNKKGYYFFDPEKTQRTDIYAKDPKVSEKLKDGRGVNLPFPLEYTLPFFDLYFDFGSANPSKSDIHKIIIRGNEKECEDFIYEIGFKVEIDGKEIFNSFAMHSYVNGCSILVENCASVAKVTKANHDALVRNRNIGTHFGDHYAYSLQETGQVDFRNDPNFSNDEFMDFKNKKTHLKLDSTSCIDYVLDVFKSGFNKTGMSAEWNNISNYVKEGKGQCLAEGLVKNGWVAIYYNPDVFHPNDNDNEHCYSYKRAKEKGEYGSTQFPPVVEISDMIINYRPTEGTSFSFEPKNKETLKDTSKLKKINDVPFGFIMGRGGTHTALIIKGIIYQVHWNEGPYSENLFDNSIKFDDPDEDKRWEWNSGLIVVPKLYWDNG